MTLKKSSQHSRFIKMLKKTEPDVYQILLATMVSLFDA
ncbi:hypothetical protein predicted by Glimmer/Critica [Streptococcus dysgalactiae subsp. equisimilis AC-2713]|uniref:Uncharacterized protein n=1 Tax=Streptococcus dysgalactiae subsp. equisimilis AC-2713 TaxID=759913 RepID=A0AB33R4V4_STREQ|nr:hypothetical protein predicted by Glimmer/Critica [Streptococcus dysgalactiae subsp. equisimilis AC-2713]